MASKFVIVGIQRTGTTWIRTTLNNHPSILALGEVFLYSRGRFPLRRTEGQGIEQSYGDFVEQSARRKLMHFVNRRGIVQDYLEQLFAQQDFEAVGFKLMRTQAKQFPMIVPYALRKKVRVIHVVRDNVLKTHISRETARRRKLAHSTSHVSVQQIALPTKGLVSKLDQISSDNFEWECVFADSPYMRLTYESFVAERDTELSRLYSFLSVEPDHGVSSNLVKINPQAIRDVLTNYADVCRSLEGTPYEWCLAE